MDISNADWKLYRERIGMWQEKYIEKLIKEYSDLLNSSSKASDKFWELDERIKKAKKHPGVIIEVRRSSVIMDIMKLIYLKVIDFSDLEGFSDELKEKIEYIMHL